jgi:hypothetical protein
MRSRILPIVVAASILMALPASADMRREPDAWLYRGLTGTAVGAVAGITVAALLFPPAAPVTGIDALLTTQVAGGGMFGAMLGFFTGVLVGRTTATVYGLQGQ